MSLRFRLNCEICGRETGTCKCWHGYADDPPAQSGGRTRETGIDKKENLKEEKETMSAWETGLQIKTPKGSYTPKSDNLETEIKAAARMAGIKHPVVHVGFDQIDDPSELPVACISGLDPGTVVEVSAYDTAG